MTVPGTSSRQKNVKYKPYYLYVIIIWLLLVLLFGAVIINADISRARREFQADALELYHRLDDKLAINETVLDGFAATVDAMGRIDRDKIRNYTSQILTRYSQIYMFEIAQKVPAQNQRRFEARMRREVSPDFRIREFGYDTDRKWHVPGKRPFYIPITFMSPQLSGSGNVLGLDLTSNDWFVQSMKLSVQRHHIVASRPFKLVEGKQGYLLNRPIHERPDKPMPDGVEDRYVMLVILTKSLFAGSLEGMQGYDVSLYYRDDVLVPGDSVLYRQSRDNSSNFAAFWLPRLSFKRPLNSLTQPFVLDVDKQLGWNILNWPYLIILFIVAIGTFLIVMRYARSYRREQILRAKEASLLFYLANHDSLTGLANRNLLSDRLDHAMKQAVRNASRLAVLFIDLDNFKYVNDKYGHASGDLLLIKVANRLRKCVRNGDTLARRSGDEFVVILENIADRETADQVADKIHEGFRDCFEIGEQQLSITTSIGVAVYPDDASEAQELLELADRRMYSSK